MIAVVRIKGQVKLNRDVIETLDRLRVRRKYVAVVFVKPTKEQIGMINAVRNFVAYGDINEETFKRLVESRGQLIDKNKKTDLKKVSEEIWKGKKYEEANLKPFFRLHPPRGGIDTKLHFGRGKGVLGDNKEKINELIMRML